MVRTTAYCAGIVLALAMIAQPVSAGICTDPDSCTLTLDETNSGFSSNGVAQSGDFGTVSLSLNTATHVVTVDIDLASGFKIINTGFPGSFGFNDSLGGGLTIGNFSSSAYSGAVSGATQTQHFAAFGYSNDAAATTGPHAGSSSAKQEVSFTVSKGSSLTDVNQLVNAFKAGGGGTAFFVVDAFDSNSGGFLGGRTGLLAVTGATPVPEPRGVAFAAFAVFLLAGAFVRRRVMEPQLNS